jgi:hypothetical protein
LLPGDRQRPVTGPQAQRRVEAVAVAGRVGCVDGKPLDLPRVDVLATADDPLLEAALDAAVAT